MRLNAAWPVSFSSARAQRIHRVDQFFPPLASREVGKCALNSVRLEDGAQSRDFRRNPRADLSDVGTPERYAHYQAFLL